jgi:glutathione S-transferase
MKLYGHPLSTCTRKVLMTLEETATPFDFVLVDFAKGEHKQPPHLARQPFGQVPALEDDGFSLYESRAMCRYIDEKAGGKLAPSDSRGRAKMEQWISIETSNFTPSTMKFIYHHVFRRPQDAAVLEAAAKHVESALGIMDAELADRPYFAGDRLSIADITFAPYMEYGMVTSLKETFARHRQVMAWWNRVSERPTWRKVAGRA